jgi:hypothetical protein
MAPEQARGEEGVGPPADVYGLGAILYECLTGRPPFQAERAIEAILQGLVEPPVPPRRIVGGIDPRVEAICLRCLEKDPAARYPSAAALADALGKVLQSPWKRRLALLTVGLVLPLVLGLAFWPRPQTVREQAVSSRAEVEQGRRLATFRAAVNDLESRTAGERSRSRYLDLSHRDPDDRPTIRARLDDFAKWWSQPGREVRVEPVEGTDLYRIDLGQLTPSPGGFWEEFIESYPYGLRYYEVKDAGLREADAELQRLAARSDLVIVRADWFLHRMSRAGGERAGPPAALARFAREYEEEALSMEDVVRELGLADAGPLRRFLHEDQTGFTAGLRPLLEGGRVPRGTWESLDLLFSPYQYVSGGLGLGTPFQRE